MDQPCEPEMHQRCICPGTFAVAAPISRVLTWVADSLRSGGVAFELSVARGVALEDPSLTVGQAGDRIEIAPRSCRDTGTAMMALSLPSLALPTGAADDELRAQEPSCE